MFVDHSPVPNTPATRVIFLETTDQPYGSGFADEVIQKARVHDATSNDGNDEIFWIVFADDPRHPWDFTERALRAELQ